MRIGVSTVRRLAGSLALLIAVAGLSACGLTPRQQIQAADTTYTGLLVVGVHYAQQPLCTPSLPADEDCADATTVRAMQAIDRQAQAALDNAQDAAAKSDSDGATLSALAVAADASVAALKNFLHEQGYDQ